MKKLTFIIIVVLMACMAKAQEANPKLDIRFGIGTSLLGTGDVQTIVFENEANLKLNQFFAVGGGLNYALGSQDYAQSSFFQLNANAYVSPFKNSRKNDFRVGTGLSWYTVSDTYASIIRYENGAFLNADYELDKRNAIGINLVLENTYTIADKYLLGLKVFTQPYFNGDINSGVLLKFGIRI